MPSNAICTSRTEHIEVRHQFDRETVEEGPLGLVGVFKSK